MIPEERSLPGWVHRLHAHFKFGFNFIINWLRFSSSHHDQDGRLGLGLACDFYYLSHLRALSTSSLLHSHLSLYLYKLLSSRCAAGEVRHLGRWGVTPEVRLKQFEESTIYDNCVGYSNLHPCKVEIFDDFQFWCTKCFVVLPSDKICKTRMIYLDTCEKNI